MLVRETLILALVIMTITICDVSYDMYIPSLPHIGAYFGVPHTVVQLTVSLNLLGGSLSGLVYGPVSDHYGRRPVMLCGIAIFLLSSIGCCFALNMGVLIALRFLQGLGAGVAGVVGYAIINDVYTGEDAARNLSIVNMVVSLSPVAGPIIGSYAIAWGYGWQLLFVIVALSAIVLLLTLFICLPETTKSRQTHLSCRSVVTEYAALFKNCKFLGYACIQGLTIMWVWASLANLPFVFIEGMDLPVRHYGYLVAISVVAYICGTFVNRQLLGRARMRWIIVMGLVLVMVPDIVVIICSYLLPELLNPWFIELIWVPSSFGVAFVTINSVATAFSEVSNKGVASAFILCEQTVFGAAGIYIVGKFYNGTVVPVAILPIVCCITCGLILCLLTKCDKKLKEASS
ncbi:multidrug effflux MFS transporter [Candidatus Anaplasma sp. TIGMIC]|uniref:multidrug effflux MFS transporter n=1 Tax=Candidatus Anaplasma sp. TIGMIC TaxID=3020713 RepID=UPI00232FC727|nr:multidrug effflux MFS transporter [Candidatus Anaplasma sp. TIGMIC]MDB1135143.1 multidrug effflux MFS transporter [Candidatus Anaplasma sp. TIGMIC]